MQPFKQLVFNLLQCAGGAEFGASQCNPYESGLIKIAEQTAEENYNTHVSKIKSLGVNPRRSVVESSSHIQPFIQYTSYKAMAIWLYGINNKKYKKNSHW